MNILTIKILLVSLLLLTTANTSFAQINPKITKFPTTANENAQLSLESYEKDHFDEAFLYISKAIELNGREPNYYYMRGLILDQQNKIAPAIADLTKSIELSLKGEELNEKILFRASLYRKQKNFAAALDDYNKIIRTDEKNALAYFYRAETNVERGDAVESLEDIEKVISISGSLSSENLEAIVLVLDKIIKLQPGSSNAYQMRGAAFYLGEKFNQALENFSKAVSLDPSYLNINLRAQTYLKLNNLEAALSDFNKNVQLNPQSWQSFHDRGEVYQNAGKYDLAIADFNKCITLDPKNSDFYNHLGICYFKKGDDAQALLNFSKVLELYPASTNAIRYRAKIYEKANDKDKALAEYVKIPMEKLVVEDIYSRGILYFEKGEYKKAEEDLELTAENAAGWEKPEIANVYLILGFVKHITKNRQSALNEYDKAVVFNPVIKNDSRLVCVSFEISTVSGPKDPIFDVCRKAIEQYPGFALGYSKIGSLFSFLNRQKDAVKYFDEAIRISPNYANAYLFRGDSYRFMNKSDNALADYRKVLQIDPNNGAVWFSLGILQESQKDYNESIKSYTMALVNYYNPRDNALVARGVSYLRIGEKYKAAQDAEAAININPNNSNAYKLLEAAGYKLK